ncbi:longevity-assurance domain-containing protein, putative [Eimeria acervulina]|uniref:Longevity-assurance domain-containing protein, putative n=1 Tax=Eimeria acervulina TaxID=5801 RepID=U6GVF3_EIMAC|nr:longevity-assurance domain-containing protein, putative [Eimeria acervulina]CDI83547.1 longevity-assurance domain-containing protein, putative [Eimeria acervulina]
MKLEAARQLIAKKLQSFRMEDGELVYHTLSFLVESEQGPFWKVYLLNPSVSYDDALYVLLALLGVTLLRLIISGGSSGALRRLPCISKKLAKSTNCVRPGKLHKFGENVWYTIWHGTAFFWGCYVLYSEFGTAEVPGWPRLHLQRPDGRCLNTALIRALTQDFVESRWRIPGGTVLPAFLVVLQILHIYWFWCIIKMVIGLVTAVRNGSREDCEDVRSEDEDDGEDEKGDDEPKENKKKQ